MEGAVAKAPLGPNTVSATGVLVNSGLAVVGLTLFATKRYKEAYTLAIATAVVAGIVGATRVWSGAAAPAAPKAIV